MSISYDDLRDAVAGTGVGIAGTGVAVSVRREPPLSPAVASVAPTTPPDREERRRSSECRRHWGGRAAGQGMPGSPLRRAPGT